MVALLGPDGAGKSVLALEIARTFPFPVRSVYMGLWRRPSPVERPILPGLDLLARLIFAWRAYLAGRYHRALGRLVIFDRYVHDARVDMREGHPFRDRLYFGILGRALPPPDLIVILDIPGAVAHARKGEHDVADLESRRQGYLSLGKAVPGAEIVDADRPLPIVRNDVTARIWRRYRSGSPR
jgi:thymidylate kinase